MAEFAYSSCKRADKCTDPNSKIKPETEKWFKAKIYSRKLSQSYAVFALALK